ncbi:MAG TPA: ABATE domain-containing protein [Oculatellaceae cyanobacterium]
MKKEYVPAIFINDAPGLDFLNSIATPVDVVVDWIKDGEGLLDWVEQARLAPTSVIEGLRVQALPGELDKVADQARNLREWFRGFVRSHQGRQLTADDLPELEPLNRLLERDEGFSRLAISQDKGQESIVLSRTRRWRSPESLLLPIAEELARLISAEDFSNVKACEGHACTLLFIDHTRGRGRRWCSMALCGNRAKQATHRMRLKSHDKT